MSALKLYLNSISLLKESTWEKFECIFHKTALKKGEYFAREGEFSKKMGFLSSGIVRAF